jgi:GNAT superfamily N-acetyltransferase
MNQLIEIDFETIFPIWRDKLWPGIEIKRTSIMDYTGSANRHIENNKVKFFAFYKRGKIIGVNSLIQTSLLFSRSRGIWVDEDMRNQGVGRSLMEFTINYAKSLNCSWIWSLPRKPSLNFYIKCGFKQTSLFLDKYEFGPNCFVLKKLKY